MHISNNCRVHGPLTGVNVLWGYILLAIARFHGGMKHDATDVEVEAHANCVTGHQNVEAGIWLIKEARLFGACFGWKLRDERG